MKEDYSLEVWSSFFGQNTKLHQAIQKIAIIKNYDAKEFVLTQQEKSRDVFYLLEGQAKVFSLSIDGKEVWLDTIKPGSLFGEVAALGTGDRTATIITKTKSKIARFKGKDFINLIEEFGSVGIAVSKLLVERIERTTRRMCELSSLSAPGRIYTELLRLAEYEEDNPLKCYVIRIIPPNTKIAVSVNSTRETVSRTLSGLEKKGLIEREGTRVTLISPDAIMDMIG